ncbi:hypothetical protein B0H13DRAFT_2308118 [Mycena leptocephala]|nr:hypothetical protein B0H13DRAFT_2308118 [Mycena leptocephala]
MKSHKIRKALCCGSTVSERFQQEDSTSIFLFAGIKKLKRHSAAAPETSPGLEEAILGFTCLNNTHYPDPTPRDLSPHSCTGCILVHHFAQVGYATCDNARNNGAMLIEFACLIKAATSLIWNPIERCIGCLAHVINIATQKLISAYSKSPHFNAHEPNSMNGFTKRFVLPHP